MSGESDHQTSEALARKHPGIENRMVALPIECLDPSDPLHEYSDARVEEQAFVLDMRRAGLGPHDVEVFDLIIRF